jgi:uncharacterized protein
MDHRLAFDLGRRVAVTVLFAALMAGNAVRAAPRESVEIVTAAGVHVFEVELAVTEEEQARGLMGRRELPAGSGLLLDFGRPSMTAMWMKDTYIPLDMIFIRADGVITKIAEDTTPLSATPILSPAPVRGVLEVAAGTARRLGITLGDRVGHRIFSR